MTSVYMQASEEVRRISITLFPHLRGKGERHVMIFALYKEALTHHQLAPPSAPSLREGELTHWINSYVTSPVNGGGDM